MHWTDSKLIENIFTYTTFRFFAKLVALLLIPFYTRVLSPEEYGIIETLTSIGLFFLIFYPLGLRDSLGRLYFDHNHDEHKLKIFLGTVILISGVLITLQVVIYTFFGNYAWKMLGIELAFFPYVFLVILAASFRVPYEFYAKICQNRGNAKLHSRLSFYILSSTIIFNIIFIILLDLGPNGFLISYFLVSIFAFLISFYFFRKEVVFSLPNLEKSKEILFYGFPLTFNAIFVFAIDLSDRFLIGSLIGLSEVGIYSLGCKFAMIILMINTGFSLAIKPYLYQELTNNNHYHFSQMYNRYLFFIFTVSYSVSIIIKYFINYFIPVEFNEAKFIAPIIILGYAINSYHMLGSKLLTFSKQVRIIPYITFFCGLFNVGLNLYLLPRYGYFAASLTTVLSFIFSSLFFCYFGQKYSYIPIKFKNSLTYLFLLISVYIFIQTLQLSSTLLIIIELFSVVFFFYAMYKSDSQFLTSQSRNFLKWT